MIRPLMMAKRVPRSIVMEVRVKAVAGMSVPPASCSALAPVTWAVGFQLMGQNGFRRGPSNSREDFFLFWLAGAPGADCSPRRARRIRIRLTPKLSLVFFGCGNGGFG